MSSSKATLNHRLSQPPPSRGPGRERGVWDPPDAAHSRSKSGASFFNVESYASVEPSTHPSPPRRPPKPSTATSSSSSSLSSSSSIPVGPAPVPVSKRNYATYTSKMKPENVPPALQPPPPKFVQDQQVDPSISRLFRSTASTQMLDSFIASIREEQPKMKAPAILPPSKSQAPAISTMTQMGTSFIASPAIPSTLPSSVAASAVANDFMAAKRSASSELSDKASVLSASLEYSRHSKSSLHELMRTADLILKHSHLDPNKPLISLEKNVDFIRRELENMTTIAYATAAASSSAAPTLPEPSVHATPMMMPGRNGYSSDDLMQTDSRSSLPQILSAKSHSSASSSSSRGSSRANSPISSSRLPPFLSNSLSTASLLSGPSLASSSSSASLVPGNFRALSSSASTSSLQPFSQVAPSPAVGPGVHTLALSASSSSISTLSTQHQPSSGASSAASTSRVSTSSASRKLSQALQHAAALESTISTPSPSSSQHEPSSASSYHPPSSSSSARSRSQSQTRASSSRSFSSSRPPTSASSSSSSTSAQLLSSSHRVGSDLVTLRDEDASYRIGRDAPLPPESHVHLEAANWDPQNTVFNRPLLPLAHEPKTELSVEDQSIVDEVSRRQYPTFFNNPIVEAALPPHKQFGFIPPYEKPFAPPMSLEMTWRQATPVGNTAPLWFHIDRSHPCFQLPPPIRQEIMRAKLDQNETLAKAERLFRNVLRTRRLLIVIDDGLPFVQGLALFVPAPHFTMLQPKFGGFTLEIERDEDDLGSDHEPMFAAFSKVDWVPEGSEMLDCGPPASNPGDIMRAPDFGFRASPSNGDTLPAYLPADEVQPIVLQVKSDSGDSTNEVESELSRAAISASVAAKRQQDQEKLHTAFGVPNGAAGAELAQSIKTHSIGGYASSHMHPDTGNFSAIKAAQQNASGSIFALETVNKQVNHRVSQQPVHGDVMRDKAKGPATGSGVKINKIDPPKLSEYSNDVSFSGTSTLGGGGSVGMLGDATSLPNLLQDNAPKSDGSAPAARDAGLAVAGETIAALTAILKDKVASVESVATSSMFAMLQQQQQQMFQMQKEQMQFFMHQMASGASSPTSAAHAAATGIMPAMNPLNSVPPAPGPGPMLAAKMGLTGGPQLENLEENPKRPAPIPVPVPDLAPRQGVGASMNAIQNQRAAQASQSGANAFSYSLDPRVPDFHSTDSYKYFPSAQDQADYAAGFRFGYTTNVPLTTNSFTGPTASQPIIGHPAAGDMSPAFGGSGSVAASTGVTSPYAVNSSSSQFGGGSVTPYAGNTSSTPAFGATNTFGATGGRSNMGSGGSMLTTMTLGGTFGSTTGAGGLRPTSALIKQTHQRAAEKVDVLASVKDPADLVPPATRDQFFLLVRNNRIQQASAMLAEGVPVNIQDNVGNSPLHAACQANSKAMVKLLLRWGAEINAQNKQGQTPLHFCFAFQFDALGAYLIEKGALDTIKNYFGWTCYDGLRPDDPDEALALLRQTLGSMASADIIYNSTD